MDDTQLDSDVRESQSELPQLLAESSARMCESQEEANENFVLGYN